MVREPEADMSVVTALVRSAFLVDATYEHVARKHQLTSQQGQLLCVLMGKPEEGFGMGELVRILGLAKSSLTGLVDRSLRRGLVRREADSTDGRAVRVYLTPEGDKLAEEFYNETVAQVAELPTMLSEQEQAQLAELLGRLVFGNQVPVVFGDDHPCMKSGEDCPDAAQD
ncbi:MarR family winged helix-turn-helix transcriptional regulator [Catenulispora pinisilvae]|uniref:MarR family winged helix-turn-helix transcriptional regulator n=1 Tax=Catenulispora pinisilvae TaxID=2705253 RepID=UPI001E4BA02C|nr:MarR family winged helix-turn-helix transcriptional regulator [Catenulispora pinisilvae]